MKHATKIKLINNSLNFKIYVFNNINTVIKAFFEESSH